MIMDINAKKTERTIFQVYDENQIGNIQYYRNLNEKINRDYPELNHGKAQIMGKINASFYEKTKNSNNIDFMLMKEIEALK